MSDTPKNPPAFPLHVPSDGHNLPPYTANGMDLRDWFAGMATEAAMRLCMARECRVGETVAEMFARRAYELADAMLAEREKRTKGGAR